MTEKLLTEFQAQVETWELVPGSGGVYEVAINGELVFSKKELKRHAEIDEIRSAIQART